MGNELASFPLVIADGIDIGLYSSFEDAERDLEGVDVEDGLYVGYDADGRPLSIKSNGARRGRFTIDIGCVNIRLAEQTPSNSTALVSLLRTHLDALGKGVASAKLEDLLNACKKIHGYHE